MKYSPMMQQYLDTKKQYSDCILFYRLGDFYEMFFEDAETASAELDLVLTSRACGNDQKAPMCGVPFHSSETYIAKLIEKGYKVAIVEQLVDPSTVKNALVPRDVIRIVTPGTIINSNLTSEKNNNYLMAIHFDESIDLAWCDLATGDFCASHIAEDPNHNKLFEILDNVRPSEIITNYDQKKASFLWDYIKFSSNIIISTIDKRLPYKNTAPSMLLAYLRDTQKQDITHLEPLRIVDSNLSMRLDRATLRNLEITETIFDKSTNGSLIGVLDSCMTAMGSRKLRQWIREPLVSCSEIQKRLDAVESMVDNPLIRNNIRSLLKNIYDFERLIARISLGVANARDLIALKQSTSVLTDIKNELMSFDSGYLNELNNSIDTLSEIYTKLDTAIKEDPPTSLREGGIIKRGYSKELDDINDSIKHAQEWLNDLEPSERTKTGIKNLKVGYNKVFGYYIEVTKSQIPLVPKDYIRKQTLVNAERYITPKLKDYENILLNAKVQIDDLEYKLFNEIRLFIKDKTSTIQKTAIALSSLDVICSFAEIALKNDYVKPIINDGDVINIKNGRHPVIEQSLPGEIFTPNDVYLNRTDSSLLLITGPNMGGKSTYMRQLALIVLMAQVGCFVPADEAEIGICDRIYTRVGASDNISMGQSTFYVEMSELAYILNTATNKSLIILDEIGRGTTTLEGLSIAWAVVETLTESEENRMRTVFATHFHELTELEKTLPGIKNLTTEVVEENNSIVFKHKVIPGSSKKSYAIQVAKLAGVPENVIRKAQEKLDLM